MIVHKRGTIMDITSLLIQLIIGAVGGNAAGKAMPDKKVSAPWETQLRVPLVDWAAANFLT